MDELNLEDKLTVYSSMKLQSFLSQPFHVASVYTGIPGKYVPVETTVRNCRTILDGKTDNIPENQFFFIGDLTDIPGYRE